MVEKGVSDGTSKVQLLKECSRIDGRLNKVFNRVIDPIKIINRIATLPCNPE